MTHSGNKPHATGDKNQQYEITTYDENMKTVLVVGWTDDLRIARIMAKGANKRPSWSNSKVLDRLNFNKQVIY